MGVLRTAIRLALILLVTAVGFVVVATARLMRPVAPALPRRTRDRAFRLWARTFCRLLGLQMRVTGPRPTGSFFLVSNHVSYVDIPLIAANVDATFVAKADLRGWPLLGRVSTIVDTIFIDRSRKRDLMRVMELVEKSLDQGLAVVVFPEGTSSRGEDVLRFKPSLLELPATRRDPVYHATVSYRTPANRPPAHRIVCWWGDAPFLSHFLRLLALPSFEATLAFGEEPIRGEDRKVLAAQLRTAMRAGFRRIR